MKLLAIAALVSIGVGCGGRVSLGDNGSGIGGLSGMGDDAGSQTDTATVEASIDAGSVDSGEAPSIDAGAVDASFPVPTLPDGPGPIVRVDELYGGGPRSMVVLADCTLLVNDAVFGKGTDAACADLWKAALDGTSYTTTDPCSPGDSTFRVTLRTADGATYSKTHVDYCHPGLPGVPTQKFVWAVWYSAGGK